MPQAELTDHDPGGHTNGRAVDPGNEFARLEAAIAEATERLAAARERAAAHDVDRAALHAELAASRDAFAAMERDYRDAVAEIRKAAAAEVERILDEARQPWATESSASASAER